MQRLPFIVTGVLFVVASFFALSLINKRKSSVQHPEFIRLLSDLALKNQPLDARQAGQIGGFAMGASSAINKKLITGDSLKIFYNPETLDDIRKIAQLCRQGVGRYIDPRHELANLLTAVATKITMQPQDHRRIIIAQKSIIKTLLEDQEWARHRLAEIEVSNLPKDFPLSGELLRNTTVYSGPLETERMKEVRYLRAGLGIWERDQKQVFAAIWQSVLSISAPPNKDLPDDASRVNYIVSLGLGDMFVREQYQQLPHALKNVTWLIE